MNARKSTAIYRNFSDSKIDGKVMMANQSKCWVSRNDVSPQMQYQNELIAFERLSHPPHNTTSVLNMLKQCRQFDLIDTSAVEAFGTLLNREQITILNRSLHDIDTGLLIGPVTPKKQRQFSCEHCSFSCTWLYDLKMHLKQKHKILK